MVDDDPEGGGGPISIFEAGAILMYLADKVSQFLPREVHRRYAVVQWPDVAGVAGVNHFFRR
jgi:GST-like protein